MASDYSFKKTDWALILGASSGFGGATAVELARHGMNICGVHFDRALTLPNAERVKKDVDAQGVQSLFFNVNASDPEKRKEVVDALKKEFHKSPESNVRVLMHSLAFGTLRPLVSKDPSEQMTQAQVEMTIDVMANSLVYWTQSVFNAGLLKSGGRVYAMTSSGGHTQLPNYGAVSAAKAALESYHSSIDARPRSVRDYVQRDHGWGHGHCRAKKDSWRINDVESCTGKKPGDEEYNARRRGKSNFAPLA